MALGAVSRSLPQEPDWVVCFLLSWEKTLDIDRPKASGLRPAGLRPAGFPMLRTEGPVAVRFQHGVSGSSFWQ